jgi:putative transposase
MLSESEFNQWCDRLNLSEECRQIVNKIRTSEPVRKVKGSGRNVSGFSSSQKMGRTIQFESHTVELPALISFYEYDDDVLEYWDQPIQLTLKCSPEGKKATNIPHVPDFFVLRTHSFGFEEWKPEKALIKRAEKYPYRYIHDEDGKWQDVLAQEQVGQLGFYFRLRTDSEIDWVRYRNLKYLKDYLDKSYLVSEEVEESLNKVVTTQPGISLTQLVQKSQIATIDDINALIATKKLYVDLSAVSLTEQERVHIFRDQVTAEAYVTAALNYSQPVTSSLQTVDIKVGSSFLLDGKCLTIDHIGDSKVILRGKDGLIRWTHEEFKQLVKLGDITNLQTEETVTLDSVGWEYFVQASPEALAEANRRYAIIKPYLDEQLSPSEKSDTPERTLRYWKAKYKKAEQEYGCGFIGLIPQWSGNPTPRYSDEDLNFIDKIIEEEYENYKQKNVWAAYEVLKSKWTEYSTLTPVPSHTFFYQRIKKRSGYKQTKKRQGTRAANQHLGPWLLEATTPRHGERPFEIVHIDHTKLDIECICPYSKENLGRPWVTAMIDAYSRRILAVYVTFDPPSYRSCMMILRICVQRFGRFPECIVVDNGKEFRSTYFDTLIARFDSNKKHRPKDVPKFSSIIERWFCSQNTQFLYNLRGNTQIMKHVRLVKKENNPKNLAVWELDQLYDYFAFGYCYGVYDQKKHPALEGFSPQQAFEFGLAKTGYRSHQTIKYDEQFKILTSPSTQKGTAKVIPGTGVRINYSDYWSDDFYSLENQSVPIRYDPLDYGIAYAYVGNRWLACISKYYTKFQGYSERAINLATTIIRRKRQFHNQNTYINPNEIIYLLEHAEEYEELQLQIRRDWSSKRVHSLIEGQSESTILDLDLVNNSSSLPQIDEVSGDESIELAEDETELSNIKVESKRFYTNDELW